MSNSSLSPRLSGLARSRLRSSRLLRSLVPLGPDTQSTNIRRVLVDGMGVGFASAAGPFLPVLLARLGAADLAIGLLSSMPAFTGLIFAIPVGQFLQTRKQLIPWYSGGRLLVIASYALTGIVALLASQHSVELILAIWALATIPATVVNVGFSVVMAEVAGAEKRFYLMSRRWSLLGLTTAVTVAFAGQVLNRIVFPLNYAIVFMVLSLGGLFSFYFSSHIDLPETTPTARGEHLPIRRRLGAWSGTLRVHPDFTRFAASQFVFRLGLATALPLFPLYYVRNLRADDASIGVIATVQTTVMVGSYFVWARISKRWGNRAAILATTLALAFYPPLVAVSPSVSAVVLLAGIAGIFSAGLDLVFFDALMATVPVESAATFVGIYQTTSNTASFFGPLLGSALAAGLGIPFALFVAGTLRLVGFLTFFFFDRQVQGGLSSGIRNPAKL